MTNQPRNLGDAMRIAAMQYHPRPLSERLAQSQPPTTLESGVTYDGQVSDTIPIAGGDAWRTKNLAQVRRVVVTLDLPAGIAAARQLADSCGEAIELRVWQGAHPGQASYRVQPTHTTLLEVTRRRIDVLLEERDTLTRERHMLQTQNEALHRQWLEQVAFLQRLGLTVPDTLAVPDGLQGEGA